MTNDEPIWPGSPPGAPSPLPAHLVVKRSDGRGSNGLSVAVPGVSIYRPQRPNGHGLLLCQGGGYEGVGRVTLVPEWFAEQGFVVFDLLYRLPAQGWAAGPDVALQDAQQAMRIIRERSQELGLTGVVGVAGFSSGGHVASSLATRFGDRIGPVAASPQVARPDFALLMCPVITMLGEDAHEGSRQRLFGSRRDEAELAARSPETLVTENTPPMFLVHAADDPVVPAENSLGMFLAMKAAGAPAELHMFDQGGHLMSRGFEPDNALTPYPGLILKWLATRFDLSMKEAAQ